MRLPTRGFVGSLLMCVGLVTGVTDALAAPRIFSTSLRYGLTPTLPAHTLASFNFTLENPDPQETSVTIALEAEEGGNVFTKTLRIGPKAVIEDRCVIMVSPTENYKSNLTWRGNQISSDKCVIRLEAGSRQPMFFINDDMDFAGTTDLTKNAAINKPLYLTTVRASNVPQNWAFFGDAVALVMVKPAFNEMNALQIQAITDFVRHGGTLLWIAPEALVEAANTPFRDLLPVTPLRVRRQEDFHFLEPWRAPKAAAMTPADWQVPAGIPLLESVPAGDGVTTFSLGDFPVTRFRRYGLGTVGMIAFDPCGEYIRKSEFYLALWNHLLSWTSRHPVASGKGGYAEQGRLMGELSGFPIPQLSTIQLLLGAYLGGSALVLIVGFLLRWHVTAWSIVALAGMCLTVGIFRGAYRLAADRANQVATSIDLRAWTDGRFQGEKTISLFSKGDARPTMQTTDRLSLFYPLTTSTMLGMYARREAFAQPLRVVRDNDRATLEKLQLQALKPRKLCMAYAEPAPAVDVIPELHCDASGPHLQPWKIPEGLPQPAYGFLCQPKGLLPLDIRDRECREAAGRGGLRLNTVASAAQEYLEHVRLPSPCLALITAANNANTRKFTISDAKFAEYEYIISIVPVVQQFNGPRVKVVPEQVSFAPGEAHTRLVMRDGEWIDATLRSDETFPVSAQLPMPLADLQADEVTVELDLSNPGGNVEYAVLLQDPAKPLPKATATGSTAPPGVAATSRRANTFVFTGLAQKALVNPQTGRLGILLYFTQKRALTDMMDAERVNRWRVNSLRVTVLGTLPATASPERY